MKNSILPLLIASLLLVGACGGGDQKAIDTTSHDQAQQASSSEQMMNHDHEMAEVANKAHAMVKLPTIQCDVCKAAIEGGLIKTAGILSVMVDLDGKMGHVNYDGDVLSLEDVEQAIADLGYQANDRLAEPSAYASLPDCCKVPQ
ncbi:MAG: heavy-metal-associated domain-containing protein [Candidatus Marinimicrobia bacterium]|nr:heavy-metal-associated domain-containing protein [Candidatus Neomarinimicrobiota bacterium]